MNAKHKKAMIAFCRKCLPAFTASLLLALPSFGDGNVAIGRHLVRHENGVVHDSKTGMEWYPGPDTGIQWAEAKAWVDELEVAGGGWRMPRFEELETLFSLGDGVANITPLLGNSGYWIWAGQTRDSAGKWLFRLSYGGEGWSGQAPDNGGRALAVRKR